MNSEGLLPDGVAGVHNEATLAVEQALGATGVRAVEAQYAEDPRAVARLTETTVWLVCDIGLARCDITITFIPPGQRPRADPVTLTLVPWSEVNGVGITATVDRPSEPLTTLTISATSPPMTLKADSDTTGQLDRLREFAAGLIRRSTRDQ